MTLVLIRILVWLVVKNTAFYKTICSCKASPLTPVELDIWWYCSSPELKTLCTLLTKVFVRSTSPTSDFMYSLVSQTPPSHEEKRSSEPSKFLTLAHTFVSVTLQRLKHFTPSPLKIGQVEVNFCCCVGGAKVIDLTISSVLTTSWE